MNHPSITDPIALMVSFIGACCLGFGLLITADFQPPDQKQAMDSVMAMWCWSSGAFFYVLNMLYNLSHVFFQPKEEQAQGVAEAVAVSIAQLAIMSVLIPIAFFVLMIAGMAQDKKK